jgi:hypothetical protein
LIIAGTSFLCNVGIVIPNYALSGTNRQQSLFSPPVKATNLSQAYDMQLDLIFNMIFLQKANISCKNRTVYQRRVEKGAVGVYRKIEERIYEI